MRNIFSAEQERNLILYSYRHLLYLRTLLAENARRPVLLCQDYLSDLSDTIYQDTIYYGYLNTQNDIVIKSIMEQNVLYTIRGGESLEYHQPLLITFQKRLLLVYLLKNPVGDKYLLKALYPFDGQTLSLTYQFSSLPELQFLCTDNRLVLSVSFPGETAFIEINEAGQDTFLESEEQLHSRLQEQASRQLSQKESEISALQNNIAEQNKLLENVKKQYDELMNTAYQYRDEAFKWRSRYYSKHASKPINNRKQGS